MKTFLQGCFFIALSTTSFPAQSQDASLRNYQDERSRIELKKMLEKDKHSTLLFVNGKLSEKNFSTELDHPANESLQIFTSPGELIKYTADTSIKRVILIRRKAPMLQDNEQEMIDAANPQLQDLEEITKALFNDMFYERSASTRAVVNGKLSDADFWMEMRNPQNISMNILVEPDQINQYTQDTAVKRILAIKRKLLPAFGDSTAKKELSAYDSASARAAMLFRQGNYREFIQVLEHAIQQNGDRGLITDRYLLAQAYCKLEKHDEAFEQLFRIAEKGNYYKYWELEKERTFLPMHPDIRWRPLLSVVTENAERQMEKSGL